MFKTLLINLNKDKDRLDFMSRQLKSLGISFERVEAIYGKEYKGNEYDKDLAVKLNGKELSVGEVGCALSHKRSVEKFLESQSDYCLILEDDVKIDKDFKNILEKEIKNNEEYYLKDKKYN
jgi:glycosyl transferase family 25